MNTHLQHLRFFLLLFYFLFSHVSTSLFFFIEKAKQQLYRLNLTVVLFLYFPLHTASKRLQQKNNNNNINNATISQEKKRKPKCRVQQQQQYGNNEGDREVTDPTN